MEADSDISGAPEAMPQALNPGMWLAHPLRHPKSGAMLLPRGTVFTRDLIEKVKLMDVEFEALLNIGKGLKKDRMSGADLLEHYSRQRTVIERVAEAYASMRDWSFVLFCMSAVLAFSFSSFPFAALAGVMLVVMLVNAWMSIHVLHRLSSLNRMYAGMPAGVRRAS